MWGHTGERLWVTAIAHVALRYSDMIQRARRHARISKLMRTGGVGRAVHRTFILSRLD